MAGFRMMTDSIHGYGVPEDVEEINYGVDIDKLVAMIEAGEI